MIEEDAMESCTRTFITRIRFQSRKKRYDIMKTTRSIRQSVKSIALAGFAALLALSPPFSWAAGEVLEPGVEHFGKSYNELTGDWYNWATKFPLKKNPIVEDGAVDCTREQEGSIWFLAGNFGGASNRTCAIPSGRALF